MLAAWLLSARGSLSRHAPGIHVANGALGSHGEKYSRSLKKKAIGLISSFELNIETRLFVGFGVFSVFPS